MAASGASTKEFTSATDVCIHSTRNGNQKIAVGGSGLSTNLKMVLLAKNQFLASKGGHAFLTLVLIHSCIMLQT